MRLRDMCGQSTIEVVAAIPLCLVAAIGLVEAGVVVSDKIAVERAATAAAVATVDGGDAEAAARGAVSKRLTASLKVSQTQAGVKVSTTSPLAVLPGEVRLTAEAVTEIAGGAR